MTHVYLGGVRSWIRVRTAKPQPSLPGPSLDLHSSPAERTSGHHTSQKSALNSADLSRVLSSPQFMGELRTRTEDTAED